MAAIEAKPDDQRVPGRYQVRRGLHLPYPDAKHAQGWHGTGVADRGNRGYRSRFAVGLYRATRLVTAPPVAVRPPSTTNCPPVVLEARSEHRKSTMLAISSAVA
jgi:hypothetical protein